ncbi:sigma-70 family RNA polymerase sigma factor [Elioraea sp. Yellowstone]|jgi:RNA polymerase sigma-70 factor (ECF subfamily)|uniref:sigma-70 family RNA polymerase sigma factor n=1 Tax=Elioraea sp. Yellowstone TaxID=2592070 RepID=UPI00114F1E71|nr:sigma-70 family RNA polymerase sigma factor [Elioraea sp. Yellowstone]TQF76788.1 sigma-70 family RNA polymerase sigma factor [Elioraea sp. Yellowstone]
MATSPIRRDDHWSALMAAAQDGDRHAYERLLREIVPFLRAVARRRLRGEADVEDAVQDALLTIHQIRHSYDPARPIRPWLGAIAERRALDRVRSVARRAGREAALTDLHHETLQGAPTNEGESRLQARDVRAAVAGLPPGQRQAIELLKLREMSLAEASARTGQSVTALKVATHRAILALRRHVIGGERD